MEARRWYDCNYSLIPNYLFIITAVNASVGVFYSIFPSNVFAALDSRPNRGCPEHLLSKNVITVFRTSCKINNSKMSETLINGYVCPPIEFHFAFRQLERADCPYEINQNPCVYFDYTSLKGKHQQFWKSEGCVYNQVKKSCICIQTVDPPKRIFAFRVVRKKKTNKN